MKFKVTNIDKTAQIWREERIEPKESIITENPPEANYTFKVEPVEEKAKK